MSSLRALRVMRMVRTFRIIRIVHFFRSLRVLVMCIFNGLLALFWALVLLIILMYLFSVICVQGAALHLRDNDIVDKVHTGISSVHESRSDILSDADLLLEFELSYGSVLRAAFSMLMAVSGGDDWYNVVKPLMNIHWVYTLAFCSYVVFTLFGVLNVLTGVFVEQALQLRDKDLVIQAEMDNIDHFLRDMQDLFFEADSDHSGEMTWDELQSYLGEERVIAYMATHQLDVSDVSVMFKLLDQDNTNSIEMEEFVLGCMRLKGQAKCLDIMRLFESLDIVLEKVSDINERVEMLAEMQRISLVSGGSLTSRGGRSPTEPSYFSPPMMSPIPTELPSSAFAGESGKCFSAGPSKV